MLCLWASAASCIASPRTFTTSMPVSKSQTWATVIATYSPRDNPATAWQRSTFSGRSTLSRSTPARPPMYMAGWQYFVSSNLDSGPLRHSSSRSNPKVRDAFVSMAFTAGSSLTADNIFTYCEPWPGKISATGSFGSDDTERGSGSATSSIAMLAFLGSFSFSFSFSSFSSSCASDLDAGCASASSLRAVARARASGPIASSASEILVPSGLHQHSRTVS
mmetsp:Transcript_48809/g.111185  ORF Transcript_48809/g.111185 Transcript_48809/m.111185 type:complete len:220 (-) Transcript_48809:368-1027(-)